MSVAVKFKKKINLHHSTLQADIELLRKEVFFVPQIMGSVLFRFLLFPIILVLLPLRIAQRLFCRRGGGGGGGATKEWRTSRGLHGLQGVGPVGGVDVQRDAEGERLWRGNRVSSDAWNTRPVRHYGRWWCVGVVGLGGDEGDVGLDRGALD